MVEIIMNGENTSTNILKNTSYTVYIHKFPNGKVYIGITGQKPNRRWRNGEGYKNKQKLVYRAINKYGWDNIEHLILFKNLTHEEAEQKEIELIKSFKANNPQYGYNAESGGSTQKHLSGATKEKLRQANLGKKHSADTRKKISEGNKGKRHLTEEQLKKMRAGRKYQFAIWNKGKTVDSGKHVTQYTKDGVFVKEWINAHEAQQALGIPHIYNVCNGKRKTAGGFVWRYSP